MHPCPKCGTALTSSSFCIECWEDRSSTPAVADKATEKAAVRSVVKLLIAASVFAVAFLGLGAAVIAGGDSEAFKAGGAACLGVGDYSGGLGHPTRNLGHASDVATSLYGGVGEGSDQEWEDAQSGCLSTLD